MRARDSGSGKHRDFRGCGGIFPGGAGVDEGKEKPGEDRGGENLEGEIVFHVEGGKVELSSVTRPRTAGCKTVRQKTGEICSKAVTFPPGFA